MINEKDFLEKYNISVENFKKAEYNWTNLVEIHDDYIAHQKRLEDSATFFTNVLHKVEQVHSIRFRLKDPEHLIEKIIRKKLENPERNITLENYKTEITDLIGIRIIHLYKEDWLPIHKFITEEWELHEEPVGFFRKGDSFNEEFFKTNGCEAKEHKAGYRSVHYLVKHGASKREKPIAEIQVRTLFEEGWSEIDHNIRYPYNLENPLLNQFLSVFNNYAKSADEMGSFIIELNRQLAKMNEEYKNIYEEKESIIKSLEAKIASLKGLSEKNRISINDDLSSLKKFERQTERQGSGIPKLDLAGPTLVELVKKHKNMGMLMPLYTSLWLQTLDSKQNVSIAFAASKHKRKDKTIENKEDDKD